MTTQKNGTTIPPNGKTNATASPVKLGTTLTVAAKNTEPAGTPANLPPLEDRILRINQLFELQGKYNRLQKSQNKLNEFKMKKGEENISLTIADRNNREEFSTHNPELIKEVLDCVRVTILERIKQIEPLLKW